MVSMGALRGVGISLFFLITVTFTCAFILAPSYILRPLSRSVHRRYVAFWMGGFWTVSVYWLEVLNGVKLHCSGKTLGGKKDTMAIIMCNHPTEFDMPFFWHIPYRLGLVGDVKFVTKAPVRKVPFLGWGIHMAEYLFLRRSLQHDLGHIQEHLGSFEPDDRALWVIFPEGTDMEAYKVPQHQAYQKENGLPILSKVLTPKHRGLGAMLSVLRVKHPDMVLYDWTMTYVPIPKSAGTIVFGKGPKECHINVRRIAVNEIPEDDAKLKDWLISAYVEKDRQLNYFADNGKFDAPAIDSPLGMMDGVWAMIYLVLFLVGDLASIWIMYHLVLARVWCVAVVVGLQLWVMLFPNVISPKLF